MFGSIQVYFWTARALSQPVRDASALSQVISGMKVTLSRVGILSTAEVVGALFLLVCYLGVQAYTTCSTESRSRPPSTAIVCACRFVNLGEMMNLGGLDGSVATLGGRIRLTGKAAGLARRAVYAVSDISC